MRLWGAATHPVALLLLLLASGADAGKPVRCLPSGDEKAINDALRRGDRGASVELCPGSVHRLQEPIVFTAPQQKLTTAGSPGDHDRALLIVEGETQATAIYADCKACAYATISNLIVDGNRPQLLRVEKGAALLELGNAEGQRVTNCRLFEPRGWSALHVREGDSLNCRKSYVADNVIGPCGEEWDDDYDGLLEKEPPWGNPRADGISVACKDSLVERNVVFDTTDGAIVLFGSAGTEVRENKVISRTRVILGGVNLVDYDPWAGDYTGVQVHHNEFHALGRYFKVAIVVGPSSWSDDTDTIVHGASVTDNKFFGAHFGYAIVVSSANDFAVLRNQIDDSAIFSGVASSGCPTAPPNGKPTAFLINRGSARGMFQDDFVNGEVQHIICVNPPDVDNKPYTPWRMRDSPAAVAAAAETEAAANPQLAAGLDAQLADALVSYQQTLLSAMNALEVRLVSGDDATPPTHARGAQNDEPEDDPTPNAGTEKDDAARNNGDGDSSPVPAGSKSSPPAAALALAHRLEILERGSASLRDELATLGSQIAKLRTKHSEYAKNNKPVLQKVYKAARARGQAAQGSPSEAATGDDGGASSMWVFAVAILLLGAATLHYRSKKAQSSQHDLKEK